MTPPRPFALRSLWVSVGLALLLALGLAPAVWANTITVDGTCLDTNLVTAICDDNTTYRTIAGAVGATGAGDIINVTTPVSHTEAGVTITHSVTIQGQGQNTTIWQAALAPGIAVTRMVTISAGLNVTITALTLQYGNVTGQGGAIYNTNSTLRLVDVNVFTNTATDGGGAIFNLGTSGTTTLWLTNTVFISNTTGGANGNGGGAIWNQAYAGTTNLNIAGSQFLSNTAVSGGGAIYTFNAGANATVAVTDTVFMYNRGLDGFYGRGGAVRTNTNNGQGRLLLENSQFAYNISAGGGGALMNESVGGTAAVQITTTVFLSNTALTGGSGGGAIYNGAGGGTANLTVTSSQFLSNTVELDGGGGGGIYSEAAASSYTSVTVTDSLFLLNLALDDFYGGGGLRNFTGGGTARVYIASTQFLSNTTVGSGGALANDALDANSFTYLDVVSSTLAYNTAVDAGGAIFNEHYNRNGYLTTGLARTMITSTVLFNNVVNDPSSTGEGGAIYSRAHAINGGGHVVFTAVNSTFTGNSADGDGGGVFTGISSSGPFALTPTVSAVLTLTHVTIANNVSGTGPGGLYVSSYLSNTASSVDLRNTILTGNSGNECSGTGDKAGVSNYIDDTSCGSGGAFRLGSAQGTLLALADNGGPTLTNALSNTSPAVDTASALYCPAADQRGTARPQGATCDVGAWEGVFSAITQFLAVDPPDGTVGQTYAYTLTADGFPVTITLQAGTLPPGLNLASSGALTGTPTLAGTYGGLVFRATNGLGHVDAVTQSITIGGGLIITANPPDGQVGLLYNHTITATGAVVSYTVTGALPPGLSFSLGGVLSGTPTLAGSYSGLVFSARNGATINASSPQTIVITEVVHITADPPDGALDEAYSYQLGGSGNPITYTLQAGTLPPGLTLDEDGWLHGTPTLAGTYGGLVFRVDNGWDTEDTAALEIVITQEFRLYLPVVLGPEAGSAR